MLWNAIILRHGSCQFGQRVKIEFGLCHVFHCDASTDPDARNQTPERDDKCGYNARIDESLLIREGMKIG